MRVLYLNPFSQEVSGPDESLLTLLGRLVPLGVEAHVAIPASGPQRPRYEALGGRTHILPMTVLRRGVALSEFARLTTSAAASLPRVAKLCREIRPDVIHTNMEVVVDGLVMSKLLGIPHVLHYRGNTLDEPKLVFDMLVRFWTHSSRRVLCISKATAALFESRGRAAKVEVLYNPIDLESFAVARREPDVRLQLGASFDNWLVGIVARLHPRKDLETFLRAAALVARKIGKARFVVVGAAAGAEEKRYEEGLVRLARDLGLEDVLTWAGSRRDIPAVMKALDVFVLTSRHEGFGRVVAEAMAAGCPVVVTDEGALPELTEGDRCGLCARAATPAAFAGRLLELWEDPALSHRLASAARERSQKFDANSVAKRVLDIYKSITEPFPTPSQVSS